MFVTLIFVLASKKIPRSFPNTTLKFENGNWVVMVLPSAYIDEKLVPYRYAKHGDVLPESVWTDISESDVLRAEAFRELVSGVDGHFEWRCK
jgi:hypothetical protein